MAFSNVELLINLLETSNVEDDFTMGEAKQRKKKKKQKQIVLLKQKTAESQKFLELLEVLEELEKKKKYVDVQICPRCKSPRVRRVSAMNGDMSGHMGLLPVKFECLDCVGENV